jgi:hypothetical protein
MMSPEYAWLTGRELLIGELEVRIEAMRARAEAGTVRGFRAGLLVFLDRRLNRVRSALATLRHLPGAFSRAGDKRWTAWSRPSSAPCAMRKSPSGASPEQHRHPNPDSPTNGAGENVGSIPPGVE